MPSAPAFSDLHLKFLHKASAEYSKDTSGEDWDNGQFFNLGDKEDPTKESYDAVDDSVVDPEVPMPELGTKEYDDEVIVRKNQADRHKALGKKIRNWLNYHAKNLKSTNTILRSGEGKVTQAKSTGPNLWAHANPEIVTKLIAQNELDAQRKQERQAANKQKDQQSGNSRAKSAAGPSTAAPNTGTSTEAMAVDQSEGSSAPKHRRNDLAARNGIVMSGFNALPLEERNEWEQKAISELGQARAEYDQIVKDPPSEVPKDRQTCIDNLPDFMQSVCNVVQQCTGWPCGMWAGGPQPAQGGRPMVTAASSGSVPGHPEMTFSKTERTAWKENVLPAIAGFLQKVFSPEECKAWALTTEELANRGDEPIEKEDGDDISRCHLNILGFEAPETSSTGNDNHTESSTKQGTAHDSTNSNSQQSQEVTSTAKGMAGSSKEVAGKTDKKRGSKSKRIVETSFTGKKATEDLANGGAPTPIPTSRPKPTPTPTLRPKPTPIPIPTSSSKSTPVSIPTRGGSPTREHSPALSPPTGLSDSLFRLSPPHRSTTRASTVSSPGPLPSISSSRALSSRGTPLADSIFAASPPCKSPEQRIPSANAAQMSREDTDHMDGAGAVSDDMSIGSEAVSVDPLGDVNMEVDDSSRKRSQNESGQDTDISVKAAKRRRGTQAEIPVAEETRVTRARGKVAASGGQKRLLRVGTKGMKKIEASVADEEGGGKGENSLKDSPTDIEFPELPARAPEYVKRSLELFVTVGANNFRWKALVRAWLAKEKQAGYKARQGSLGISKQDCPIAVGMWINRGRKKFDPRIDLDNHALRFSKWWGTMQPEDRVEERVEEGEPEEPEDSFNICYSRDGTNWGWDDIFIFGPNGAVSIIAALVWWMEAVGVFKEKANGKGFRQQQEAAVHEEKLTEALEDVYYVSGV
ncbi:hypothetical protein BT96DRAFT_1003445 [Gymnopus androsaceus JB14]|uniref:Uncharacterized protein n=1 Tax=Gymnopus androsaceus JB14 TaxID=1447944 RepID=A0A6A4GTU5_9AGAR|nr:hypothetical protein BT96DRAFT_1003445 [Gymnopus androsaceus JB14]